MAYYFKHNKKDFKIEDITKNNFCVYMHDKIKSIDYPAGYYNYLFTVSAKDIGHAEYIVKGIVSALVKINRSN